VGKEGRNGGLSDGGHAGGVERCFSTVLYCHKRVGRVEGRFLPVHDAPFDLLGRKVRDGGFFFSHVLEVCRKGDLVCIYFWFTHGYSILFIR
jgi:hypothetical protein